MQGLQIEAPLMNAGGVVKTVEDARLMAATGVGAVVGGSYTLEGRPGNGANGETVYHHNAELGLTVNALGMPNKGVRYLTESGELKEIIEAVHGEGKPFILNFAPVSDDPIAEVAEAFQLFERVGVRLDGFELNGSCPNVVLDGGKRHGLLSHHLPMLADTLGELSDIRSNEYPVDLTIVRIAPIPEAIGAAATLQAIYGGADAIAAFNTKPGGKPMTPAGEPILQVPGGIGGQSGKYMAPEMEHLTKELMDAKKALRLDDLEVIGSNGIADAETMKRRLDLGVAAVSAATLFYEAADWGKAVDKLIQEYAAIAT